MEICFCFSYISQQPNSGYRESYGCQTLQVKHYCRGVNSATIEYPKFDFFSLSLHLESIKQHTRSTWWCFRILVFDMCLIVVRMIEIWGFGLNEGTVYVNCIGECLLLPDHLLHSKLASLLIVYRTLCSRSLVVAFCVESQLWFD